MQKFKTILITDQMHTMCFHIHPAMTSIYISFRVSMTIIHSCFFLSFSSYPTKNTLSHTLRTGLRARSEGLFHLLLKYWSARGTHIHTFISTQFVLHQINHTDNQNHTLYKKRESINESMMIRILYSVILITISSIGSWNYTENI